ncbi:MAG: alkaline phosphatase family protein [Chitinophagaceae bacterium]|nr:MAG: alkaline phosphatase family protein [Chitinophagaceae bacterium]
MKQIIIMFFYAFCFIQGYSQKRNHVVLISVDGLRPEFYLDKKWPTPNMQRMVQNGSYSRGVRTVFPSVTYPAHTTIVTGAYPAKHGIYYNAPVDGKKGQWYWEESYIKVPTLWDAVHEAGLTSGSVMWPVTVGAPIDYNFPVKRADDDASGDQLEVTAPYVTPPTLLDEYQKTTGKLTVADFNTSNSIDVTIGNLGAYIIKTYKPNLLALHFVTADHEQHSYGRDGAEVKHAVALIDSMIGVVIKSIQDAGLENSTDLIITGDHGFVNANYNFAPNVLLQQNQLFNTSSKIRFHATGGAAFLYAGNVKDKTASDQTVRDKASVDQVKSLLNSLTAEEKKAFRVIDRAELNKAGVNPEVLLGLAMSKNYVATNNSKGELLSTKKTSGAHGYFPDLAEIHTGFIASGPSISKNKMIDSMGIKDVAPLIADLLGLSFKSPDGSLPPGIISRR